MIDIIIPTYKNKEALISTLESLNPRCYKHYVITIVDDCSGYEYEDIKKRYPFVKIYMLPQNCGPGAARQFGVDHTSEPYIWFLDSGDLVKEYKLQKEVCSTVQEHPDIKLFEWKYICNEKVGRDSHNHIHGRIYQRQFLKDFGIRFSIAGSRTNEDIGFHRACRMALRQLLLDKPGVVFQMNFEKILVEWTVDSNSLTRKNNGQFLYDQQNQGLAINEIHAISNALKNHYNSRIIAEEISDVMCSLYFFFMLTATRRPEYIQNSWTGAKLFYDKIFIKFHPEVIDLFVSMMLKKMRNSKEWTFPIPMNIRKFLKDLSENEQVPKFYCFNC